jgi:hypothetical protein
MGFYIFRLTLIGFCHKIMAEGKKAAIFVSVILTSNFALSSIFKEMKMSIFDYIITLLRNEIINLKNK